MSNHHIKKDFHICVISDEGYAVPTTTMLTSALYNKNKNSNYIVHCLNNGMSNFSITKIMELNRPDFQVIIKNCSADKYNQLKMPPNITASTMIKCDIAELLDDVDNVLLIDGDILVLQDLSDVSNIDLGDNILAAVSDMVGVLDSKLDKKIEVEDYFNAGVMWLNLKRMRKEKIGEKIIEAKLKAPDTWILGEQDPFNKICDKRWTKLPPSWNVEILLLKHLNHTIRDINAYYKTNYNNYTELEDSAKILHFCCFKPWKNRLMPYAPIWQKYHDISPYSNTDLHHDSTYPLLLKTKTTWFNIFGIPLTKTVETELRIECKLFGFIRLYKIKKRGLLRKMYLFGLLPIYTKNINIYVEK